MDLHISLILCLLSALGFCSCQNELLLNGPLNGVVGESVEFTLINPPYAPPRRITWSFSGYREVTIFTSIGEAEIAHVDYAGRISLDKTTASLELRGLTLNDTGLYTVSISISGVEYRGVTSLTVFEKISNVKAEANQNELVEFNSSVILMLHHWLLPLIFPPCNAPADRLQRNNGITLTSSIAHAALLPILGPQHSQHPLDGFSRLT
ncbi:SLAM family member 9-like [Clupea harengus]|uniref:SLAM family member 9-like n=1 Tax=Clupea harengus TaxID=7950 RepID=A0A8M1KTV7_CLUHA|nr:SLAM family member 9-like [Clupea harengus]